MHVGGVHPGEERLARFFLACDEVDAGLGGFVVDGLHALLGERSGVLDSLLAQRAEARVDLIGFLLGGPGMHHTARQHLRAELRSLLFGWVVRVFGLFLGVEVVQVAEELVETVCGGQVLVEITEMVLAELASGITDGLEQCRDRRVFR